MFNNQNECRLKMIKQGLTKCRLSRLPWALSRFSLSKFFNKLAESEDQNTNGLVQYVILFVQAVEKKLS